MPYNVFMDNKPSSAIARAAELVGSKSALARLVGVTPPTVQQWANGERPVPPERCVLIERVTGGAVGRRDLRPDDWHLIWPELDENKSRLRSRPDAARDSEGAEASSYGAALLEITNDFS